VARVLEALEGIGENLCVVGADMDIVPYGISALFEVNAVTVYLFPIPLYSVAKWV
jgi:hypothetical protein